MVAVDLDRSLDMWMGSQGDLQFYKSLSAKFSLCRSLITRPKKESPQNNTSLKQRTCSSFC